MKPSFDSPGCLLVLLAFSCLTASAVADVVINEIVASNRSGTKDEDDQFDDWIELRNLSGEQIDLGGMFLTDSLGRLSEWMIPDGTTLSAGAYVLIWADGHPAQGSNHASFSLARSGGTVALVDRDGMTVIDQVEYSIQAPDISIGRSLVIDDESLVYYPVPTPGQPNITTGVSILAETKISVAGGLFREPVEVALSTLFESGEIRYTLDGEQPTAESALYNSVIVISETSSVTAAVFSTGRRVGPVASEVFVFVGDDLADFSSNLPLVVVESRGYRFSRDSSLSKDFPPELVYAVLTEPDATGRAKLSGKTNYVGRAGMNVRGASSREWPKKSYKFETWDAMDGNEDVSLLGLPHECDWILHGPYFDKTFMRNYLTYLWWERLGHFSVRTRFIELFINQDEDRGVEMEDYVGVYLLMEKIKSGPDRVDVMKLEPFDIEEAAISGGYVLQTTNIQQHFTSRRGVFMKYVSPRREEITTEQRDWIRDYINDMEAVLFSRTMLSDPVEGYTKWIDLPSHIDYDIMREMSRNIDGASTYMSLDRAGKLKMGPLWDYNQSFGMTSLFGGGWKTDGWNNDYMNRGGHWAKWWDKLDADDDYQTHWNDRWVELRRSTLKNDVLLADINEAEMLLEEAQRRNYEKWKVLGKSVWITGSPREAPGYQERDTFAKEVAWMREWLVNRLAWIDAQVPAPPVFTPSGGVVDAGSVVAISPGTEFKPVDGTIYYTVDGSDPRLPGGELNPVAKPFINPIFLDEAVTLTSRSLSNSGDWSTLRSASFLVGARKPSIGDLVITEIHYNPEESQRQEFIEITNASEFLLDMTGISVTNAVQFTFPLLGLEPGASIVIVEDEASFRVRYGDSPRIAGQWIGQLANRGESLSLNAVSGGVLEEISYDDEAPWPIAADGTGPSLELSSLDVSTKNPASWRASLATGGSPGALGIYYGVWAASQFTNGEPSRADEDADFDGATNFLEFALGTNPIDRSSLPIVRTQLGGDFLQVVYRRRSGISLVYGCEQSSDLKNWQPCMDNQSSTNVTAAGADEASRLEDVMIQFQLASGSTYIRISASE